MFFFLFLGLSQASAQCDLIDFTGNAGDLDPMNGPDVTIYFDANGMATLDQAAMSGVVNPQGVGCNLYFYDFPAQATRLGSSVTLSCDGSTAFTPGFYFVVADDDAIAGGNESNPIAINVIVLDTFPPSVSGNTCGTTVTANTSDDGGYDCETTVNFDLPSIMDNCYTNSTVLTISYAASDGNPPLPAGPEMYMGSALQDSLADWMTNGFERVFFGATSLNNDGHGTTIVTFSLADGSNPAASCQVEVEVTDDEDPVIECPDDITVSAGAGCTATGFGGINVFPDAFPFVDTDPLSPGEYIENCGPLQIRYMLNGSTTLDWTLGSNAAVEAFNVGFTTVVYELRDSAGNTASCSFIVTVEDQQAPTFACPPSITVNTDAMACEATNVMWTEPTPTDNCDMTGANVSLVSSHNSGDDFPLGITTVSYRATDNAGNSANCSFTVTVVDNQAPMIACPTDQDYASCLVGTDEVAEYRNLGVVTDNCVNQTITQTPTPGTPLSSVTLSNDVAPLGISAGDEFMVTLTATDNGTINSASCTFTVTIQDRAASYTNPIPTITGVNLPEADYECGALILVTPTATDFNCPPNLLYGVPSISTGTASLTPTSMDGMGNVTSYSVAIMGTGDVTITWTYTDANNVTSTQFQDINNVPDEDPVLTVGAPDITVFLDAAGSVTVTPGDFFASATDDCGPTTITLNNQFSLTYDCDDIGLNSNISIVARDNATNTDLIFGSVFVVDNINPVLIGVPASTTVDCDDIPALPAMGTITATDNCSIVGISMGSTSTKSNIPSDASDYNYTIVRSWTATDPSMNQTTFSQTITVEDNDAPEFSLGVDTIFLSTNTNNCVGTLNYQITADSVADNCAPFANLMISNTRNGAGGDISGNYSPGNTTVFFTASDPSGNSNFASIVVNVSDNTPPIASCLGGTPSVSIPPSDTLILPVSFINNGSFDNCGLASLSLSKDTFTCIDAGLNFNITLTARDVSGNESTCNTTVMIQDNIAPTAICQDVTVTLDNNGFAALSSAQALDNGSFDNCTGTVPGTGNLTFTASQLTFDADDALMSPLDVDLFVQDIFGNRDACTARVFIDIPETCFNVIEDIAPTNNAVSGTAATTVQAPVLVENFINVQGFQWLAVIDDPSVAEFTGISNNNLPGSGLTFQIVSTDTMNISWFNNAATNNPATLADGSQILDLDVLLVGNVNESTNIRIIGTNAIPSEVTRLYNSTTLRNTACATPGTVIIDNAAQLTIAGTILTEDGRPVGNADIILVDSIPSGVTTTSMDVTDTNGEYEFSPVSAGRDFKITPEKDINWANGIAALDLAIVQRHIVGIDTLTSPYKKIAADASGDNSISTFDVVQLFTLLSTGITGTPITPPGNTSWRFVPADFVFPPAIRRVVPTFPEMINLPMLATDSLMNDWIGVKIGDVDTLTNDMDPLNLIGSSADDRGASDLVFTIADQSVEAGESFEVQFKAKDFTNMMAYQWLLNFDESMMQLDGVNAGELNNFTVENVNTIAADQGKVSIVWFDVVGNELNDDEVIFSLRFTANEAIASIENLFEVGDNNVGNFAYTEDQDKHNVTLEVEAQATADFALYQNRPNPFRGQTVVSFTLPEAATAKLSVYDLSGRMITVIQDNFNKGYNEIELNKSQLSGAGVFYYQLDTPDHSAVKKMVIIE